MKVISDEGDGTNATIEREINENTALRNNGHAIKESYQPHLRLDLTAKSITAQPYVKNPDFVG